MRAHMKTELRKIRRSPFLLAGLAAGLLLVLLSTYDTWQVYCSEMGVGGQLARLEAQGGVCRENVFAGQTLYNSWIGADKQSLGAVLFFIMAPLLAALPCGWSFSEELHSGYLHIIAPKKGRRPYFAAKLAVAFLTGGLMVALPQLVSLLITALYLPAVKTGPIYSMYTALGHGDLFAEVFYTHPLAYVLLVIGMDFLFGGLFAWLSLTAAFFTRSRTVAVIAPFLLMLLADSAKVLLYYLCYVEISPLNMLHPMSAPGFLKGWAVLAWMGLLAAGTAPVILIRGCRREIF